VPTLTVKNEKIKVKMNLQDSRNNDNDNDNRTLTPGFNFRIIQGKQHNSRIIVQDNFCYILERQTTVADEPTVHYVKCKYPSCPARGIIKANSLQVRKEHTCDRENGQSLSKIAVQEVMTRMKRRAATEGTTFYVSIITHMFTHLR